MYLYRYGHVQPIACQQRRSLWEQLCKSMTERGCANRLGILACSLHLEAESFIHMKPTGWIQVVETKQ